MHMDADICDTRHRYNNNAWMQTYVIRDMHMDADICRDVVTATTDSHTDSGSGRGAFNPRAYARNRNLRNPYSRNPEPETRDPKSLIPKLEPEAKTRRLTRRTPWPLHCTRNGGGHTGVRDETASAGGGGANTKDDDTCVPRARDGRHLPTQGVYIHAYVTNTPTSVRFN